MGLSQYVYTSAIVLIPPEDIWPPVQAIRQRYDEKVRRWMPHITMIYPFWPQEEFARAVDLLHPACEKVHTFELTLARFGFFDHGRGKYTLWLDPQPNELVEALHRALVDALGIVWGIGPFRPHFRPHLSVGQVRGQAQRDQLFEELSAQWQPLRFDVRDVVLIWRKEPPDDIFRVGYRIPLASK